MLGDLAMASIVHKAPSESMTSTDQEQISWDLCATSSSPNPTIKMTSCQILFSEDTGKYQDQL